MKLITFLCIAAVFAAVDAFTTPSSRQQPLSAASFLSASKTPFFLQNDNDPPKQKKKTPTPPKTPPPIRKTISLNTKKDIKPQSSPRPTISLSPQARKTIQLAATTLKKEIVDPLLSGDIEKGVHPDAIKGAALTGASLTLLAGQGLVLTTTAGLGAAYVALSPGVGGRVVREIGGAAWESAQAAAQLYEKYGMSTKLSQASKQVVSTTMEALQKRAKLDDTGMFYMEDEPVVYDVSIPYDAAARLAFQDEQLAEADYPTFKQKWEAQQVADVKKKHKAKQQAQEKKLKAEEAKQLKAKQEEEAKLAAEQAKAKKEEARLAAAEQAKKEKEEEARLAAEEAKKQKEIEARMEARRAADQAKKEQEAEEARLAAEEQEVEKARLAAEMKKQDDERLAEETRKREEARKKEEEKLKGDIAVEQDDDLEATIRLAEQILDGTIAGLDDAIADTDAKEEWDSAGRLAQDLGKGADDDDDLDDEQDMAVLAQAAREAVEKFEEEMKTQDVTKAKQKELWDSEMVTDEDFDYDEDLEELREEYDDEEDEDMEELEQDLSAQDFGDVDLEELGRQARAAVQQFESGVVEENEMQDDIGKAARDAVVKFSAQEADPDDHSIVTDWSKFTVAQLRQELKSRGLKTTGRKADLVATMTAYDFDSQVQREETGEGVMWDANPVEEPTMEDIEEASSDEPDMEEMARAAREAVELFEQQQEEVEEIEVDSSVEYEAMTVNELKDELRNRGLKISGRKAELIERLRSS